MSNNKQIVLLISFILIFFSSSSKVLAAEFCDDQYYINQTLDNGAKWEMCWSHSKNQGIHYHHIFYQADNDSKRLVLFDASIAQIHVPYDDNGARFHDVSDFGLGDDGLDNNNLVSLRPEECLGGTLGSFNGKTAVCHRVISNGSSYRKGTRYKDSQLLKVFSLSQVGQYIYDIEWNFHDDGRINPTIVATGALQRFSATDNQAHGWLVNAGTQVGLAHMHNFYWRLDFDIEGTGDNDIVEEVNFDTWQGKRYKTVTRFSTESARSVDPGTMRSWIVKDGNTTNSKGHNISYEIRLNESGQREVGPSFEPFTNNDFYVTRFKDCELFASHNASVNNCDTNNLAEYVSNRESIVNQDIVTWVGVSFYHMPRSEDASKMDTHVSGFQLVPRDWHMTNPTAEVSPPSLRLVANDDFSTSASAAILIDVMANDAGQSIQINTVDNPENGIANIINNKIQYTPDEGFIGTDIFWHTIKDSNGEIFGARIHVEVVAKKGINTGGGVVSFIELTLLLLICLFLREGHFRKPTMILSFYVK